MEPNQRVIGLVDDKDSQRKLLALDGGGIRGIVSVEVLARIESLLRAELGKGDDFVLADYFDFFAGTSTGAIIACCLSKGMSTDKIRTFYLESGQEMFKKNSLLARLRAKYDDDPLTGMLKTELGEDTTLGSQDLRTLLLMVMHNVTTDSPWFVNNNPYDKYNDLGRDDCNLQLNLAQLVRASTAAPVYFPPEFVQIGQQTFVFQDGGISMYNNPAFAAFLMATVQPYQIQWRTGESSLLVVSVGTGWSAELDNEVNRGGRLITGNAAVLAPTLMNGAKAEQDTLCRVFGKCLVGDPIDLQIGDLIGARGPVSPKLFTYLRYDFEVSRKGLSSLGLSDIDPEQVAKLDSTDYIGDLQRIGKQLANKVEPGHFADFT